MIDYSQVIEQINNAGKILIFTHTNMDGDAVGSSLALCRTLRAMGKGAFIIVEDAYPSYLNFLKEKMGGMPYFLEEAPFVPDLSIALDFGDTNRLENRKEAFLSAKHTACIDHHIGDGSLAEHSVVDESAAATAVLVYELLNEGHFAFDKISAECLYVGILTDTGSFRYSNADKRALNVVAELYDYGIDNAYLCSQIYDNYPQAQLKLEALALDRAVVIAGGMAVISWCELSDIEALGAEPAMAETCIDRIRSIQGVEVAAFIKQKAEDVYKVSFRAKSDANVNWIAKELGGGGHVKASGCTIEGNLDYVKTQVTYALVAEVNRLLHERNINNQ